MKKLYILLLLLAISAIGAIAQDFTFTYGDFNFTINDDNKTVSLTGHVDGFSATGPISIPSMAYHDGVGYDVTIIGQQAFYYCEGLTGQLVIPNTVKEIKPMAFFRCTGFTGLTLSNALTDLGNDVFNYCGFTGTINIPKHLKHIDVTTFYCCNGIEGFVVDPENDVYDSRNNCNAIMRSSSNELIAGCKNTIIPNNTYSICNGAFWNCISLTSIEIPNSVTNIGKIAFSGCTSLKSLVIPDSVTSIGDEAFNDCTGLTSIMIPRSVNSIGRLTFAGCSNLIEIAVSKENQYYCSDGGVLFNKDKTTIIQCPCYMNEKYSIPNGVSSIGESAFRDCSNLKLVTIPNSVTKIESDAFDGCTNMMSIVIPNSVTSIGYYAFYGCSCLASIELPDSITSIGEDAFIGCSSLKEIYVPNGEKARFSQMESLADFADKIIEKQ